MIGGEESPPIHRPEWPPQILEHYDLSTISESDKKYYEGRLVAVLADLFTTSKGLGVPAIVHIDDINRCWRNHDWGEIVPLVYTRFNTLFDLLIYYRFPIDEEGYVHPQKRPKRCRPIGQ